MQHPEKSERVSRAQTFKGDLNAEELNELYRHDQKVISKKRTGSERSSKIGSEMARQANGFWKSRVLDGRCLNQRSMPFAGINVFLRNTKEATEGSPALFQSISMLGCLQSKFKELASRKGSSRMSRS